MSKYSGGCHCKKVRFEVEVELPVVLHQCNCSMCIKVGFLHLISPAHKFKLLTGLEHLQCYTFNTQMAKHYFCRHCGVKSFYIPRSNPDGYSVNARCLDSDDWEQWQTEHFDGQNWEKNAQSLAHLSKK
ncbi:GFA family protein [Thalassotalea aquiviva]|uniref:GFA family protein n=1 Tax=Thalassotalea aquiviva TaxID=3242415 RepID=UPI003529E63F